MAAKHLTKPGSSGTICWRHLILLCAFGVSASPRILPGQVQVSPSPSLTIRGEAPPLGLIFGTPTAAVRLSNGEIVVADGSSPRLARFNAAGAFLGHVGREGEGPGEFRRISWMGSCGGDTVAVFDPALARISLFRGGSDYSRAFRPPIDAALVACSSRGGNWATLGELSQTTGARESPRVARAMLVILNREGRPIGSIPNLPSYEVVNVRGAWLPRPLGRVAVLGVRSGSIVVGPAEGWEVNIFDLSGAPTPGAVQPERNPRRPTLGQREKAAGDLAALLPPGPIRYQFKSNLLATPPVEALPPFTQVLVDTEDWVWLVRSHETDAELRVEAYNEQLVYIGTVRLRGGGRLLDVGLAHLLVGQSDADGVVAVNLYELVRGRRAR